MSIAHPKSNAEIGQLGARYYDLAMDIMSLGNYGAFIRDAIKYMEIKPDDRILDLGAGTGRNACEMMKYLSLNGELVALEISTAMISQFEKRCARYPNVRIIHRSVDQSLTYTREFDKVFLAFVLHGFPQTTRELIIENSSRALRDNGSLFILDYNEFSLGRLPFYTKFLFYLTEHDYAFDFIKRDWKKILTKHRFCNFNEHFFFDGYVRLLKAVKTIS